MSYKKKFQSLTIKDDFMFGVVMSDVSIAKRILCAILAEEIPDIESCELQKSIETDHNSHGVRYDVYIKTRNGWKVYDVEMQNSKNRMPAKRSRYYQSSSDIDFLEKNKPYTDLPQNYVIFICDFDPFGKGRAVYQFQNYCVEEGIFLGDGTCKIFLNIYGRTERKELQNLMAYFKDNVPNDELTNDIQDRIDNAVHSGKLYSSYIKEQQNAILLKEEGRKEGRKEGKAEAIKQLLKKGLTAANIISLFDLSDEEAAFYFGDMQTV